MGSKKQYIEIRSFDWILFVSILASCLVTSGVTSFIASLSVTGFFRLSPFMFHSLFVSSFVAAFLTYAVMFVAALFVVEVGLYKTKRIPVRSGR